MFRCFVVRTLLHNTRVASRRYPKTRAYYFHRAPRSTDMSLMYGKEKDDETGTVLVSFFDALRLIK